MSRKEKYSRDNKNFVDKILNFIGLEEEIEEQEETSPLYEEEEKSEPWRRSGSEKAKVLSLYTQKQQKVVVMEPKVFEDVQSIANHLRSKHPVIINLETVEKGLARRIVDFVSGAVYAFEGSMQRISNAIFLFTPNNTDIAMEQIKEQMQAKTYPDLDYEHTFKKQ